MVNPRMLMLSVFITRDKTHRLPLCHHPGGAPGHCRQKCSVAIAAKTGIVAALWVEAFNT